MQAGRSSDGLGRWRRRTGQPMRLPSETCAPKRAGAFRFRVEILRASRCAIRGRQDRLSGTGTADRARGGFGAALCAVDRFVSCIHGLGDRVDPLALSALRP